MKTFKQIFQQATSLEPFPFQAKFAETLPSLVRVPTGLGKTAAVVLGWLWRRRFAQDEVRNATPRRLVYCLPMRVLVEQTRDCVSGWIQKLGLENEIDVHVLMGGEDKKDWDLHPEREAVFIGTQDMLLSCALNRGYSLTRFRWPMAFGLFNNDCLWVMDEVQLMDASLPTSTQLDGFRKQRMGSKNCQTVWMSATLENEWMKTVDSDSAIFESMLELDESDDGNAEVQKRWDAHKKVERCECVMGDATAISEMIVANHQPDSLTLAIFNTVDRAKEVYQKVQKQCKDADALLLHSRFRSCDREGIIKRLLEPVPPQGRIVISTQVVEAGIDISAQTLFTELAPWASLVQRFGRCNRKGEYNKDQSANVYWFDLPEEEKTHDKMRLPYELADVTNAQALFQSLENASPSSLDQLRTDQPKLYRDAMTVHSDHVIRKRDLIDLFDTTPDMAGADIDISRFIRSDDSKDVQVFWRDWAEKEAPSSLKEEAMPRREELCTVPIGAFKDFCKKNKDAKLINKWDDLQEEWTQTRDEHIYPGQVFMLHSSLGGYTPQFGWIGHAKKNEPVEPITADPGDTPQKPEGYASDRWAENPWLNIAQHTDHVVAEMEAILQSVAIDEEFKTHLLDAARWHDRGKAHEVFQNRLYDGDGPDEADKQKYERPPKWQGLRDLAKAPNGFWKRGYERNSFRHELASGLAILQAGLADLIAYLAAAHHGKVRLSIRSMPNEKPPQEAERLFARGVYDQDALPKVDLGDGVTAPAVELSLQCMQLGRDENNQPSWAERMLKLRDNVGLFRLAYLEALIRAADMRASAKEDIKTEASK
ncbi:MAG: CRISPR-associated helicase Cas3' [Candidatus Hinthialibacter antarcticus]|nr:CRISPR-associated helicase Cas3' [Candidatus Hinthialibacter antarcticus]